MFPVARAGRRGRQLYAEALPRPRPARDGPFRSHGLHVIPDTWLTLRPAGVHFTRVDDRLNYGEPRFCDSRDARFTFGRVRLDIAWFGQAHYQHEALS